MRNQIFEAKVLLPHSPERVFGWHERDGAFERLSPPWMDVRCPWRRGGIGENSSVLLHVRKGPLVVPWLLGHRDYVKNERFVDFQIKGPFDLWQQTHIVTATAGGATLLDRVEYRLPLAPFSQALAGWALEADLQRMFRYRHTLLRRDLDRQKKYGEKPLKILVSGGSGLIGSHLIAFLLTQGHSVVQLVRSLTGDGGPDLAGVTKIVWDPQKETIAAPLPAGLDAAVHLGGHNVAAALWSSRMKAAIEESRVKSTAYLVKLFAGMEHPPEAFICASAMDFYGDTGDRHANEDTPGGRGFLADICRRWEEAANEAGRLKPTLRVVNLRISGVLSPRGGPLAKLLPVFRLGGGGPVGDGKQYFSWISMDDMLGCIYHAIVDRSLSGPLNAVAPGCVTYGQFADTLGQVLGRPAMLPMPAPLVRAIFGEMGEALLLTSRRLTPQKLQQSKYEFLDPDLSEALKYTLGLSAGYVDKCA